MKRLMLWPVLLVAAWIVMPLPRALAAKSPISRGSRIVAGAITFASRGGDFYEDENGERRSEWRLYPSGGYFIRDRISVNLILEIARIKQGGFLDQIWAVGPGARFYFGEERKTGGTFYFIGGSYLLGQYVNDPGLPEVGRRRSSLQSLNLDTGITYMISDAVGATLSVLYDLTWVKQAEPGDGSSWVSGNNIGFEFGFTTFLF